MFIAIHDDLTHFTIINTVPQVKNYPLSKSSKINAKGAALLLQHYPFCIYQVRLELAQYNQLTINTLYYILYTKHTLDKFLYRAKAMARFSRITVTLICPGYCISVWILLEMRSESSSTLSSLTSSLRTITRSSRPA